MKESKELEKFNCKREMNIYIRKNKGRRDEIVRLTSSNMTNTSFFFYVPWNKIYRNGTGH